MQSKDGDRSPVPFSAGVRLGWRSDTHDSVVGRVVAFANLGGAWLAASLAFLPWCRAEIPALSLSSAGVVAAANMHAGSPGAWFQLFGLCLFVAVMSQFWLVPLELF
jgi:hypothetical protein